MAMVAMESKKQAAKRPKPPLPKAASFSISTVFSKSRPKLLKPAFNWSLTPKLSAALLSMRPIKNSNDK